MMGSSDKFAHVKLLREKEAMERYGFSRSKMIEVGKTSNAFTKIGKCVRYDKDILDDYFSKLRGERLNG